MAVHTELGCDDGSEASHASPRGSRKVARTLAVPDSASRSASLLSNDAAIRIVDCYDLPSDTVGLSDHCPVMLVLKI